MMEKRKNGFTLVELLAVIVIIGLIIIIAVPKVLNTLNNSKKRTFELTAKAIIKAAEEKNLENEAYGLLGEITCEGVSNIPNSDFSSCDIEFDNEGNASVTIVGKGRYKGLSICNGTKIEAKAQSEECDLIGDENNNGDSASNDGSVVTATSYLIGLFEKEETQHNGLIKDDTKDENIRYAGSSNDVKNKVYFNCAETDGTNAYGSKNYNYENSCEIWRIIGVFNTYSSESDTVGEMRIKIVRDEVLSKTMPWDTTEDGVVYINQWGETTFTSDNKTVYKGASLKQYLNDGEESYYNSLTSIAKEQLDEALWYTGAVVDGTASVVYESERSDATGTSLSLNYTTEWVGKIGLIYPSDFGYAGTNCGNYTIQNYSNENSCGKTSNWLTPSSGDYYILSPYASDSSCSWHVSVPGFGYGGNCVTTYRGVRPAVYLSSNVEIIGGNGGTEPFKLK